MMIQFDLEKKKKIPILIILVVFLAVCLYFFVISPAIRPQAFRTANYFTIGLHLNGHISNATFLLPLPVKNGAPQIGTRTIGDEIFKRGGFTTSLITENGGVYLKISVPSLTGINKDAFLADDTHIDFPDSDTVFQPINTRDPLGNEPVFLPKNNLTSHKSRFDYSLTWYGFNYNPVISRYQIPVYAQYSASNDTSIEIFAWEWGNNVWAELGTYFSNSYKDAYRLSLQGSSDGWYMADGTMETGEGKYLNS